MPKPNEFMIQRSFVLWFRGDPQRRPVPIEGARMQGVISWHTPNQGNGRDARQGKHLKDMGVEPGIPDYFAFYQSRLFVWEFKDEDGEQSGAQDKMQGNFLGQGAAGWLTTCSVRAAAQQAVAWGLVRPDAIMPPFAF